jgi:anti-anti-sigma factor
VGVAGQSDLDIIRAGAGWIVSGELDTRTASSLARALSADPDDDGTWHLDVAGVTFIDSSGLGALVALAREAAERGGSLRLDHPSTSVTRLLGITKMNEMFGIG